MMTLTAGSVSTANLKVPSMSVDLAHPAAEKIVLVLEGIGDDKIRIHSSSLDQPLTILPDQALEIVAIAKITIRPGSRVSLLAQP
jgi:hypothetical protein